MRRKEAEDQDADEASGAEVGEVALVGAVGECLHKEKDNPDGDNGDFEEKRIHRVRIGGLIGAVIEEEPSPPS